MINPFFASEITYHPAILHIECYNCNYQCYYCYAKDKHYDFKLQSIINLINRSKTDHSNIYKYLFGNGFPICISNNNDPFCKNNIENIDILEPIIYENGNSIFWQTKGGDNQRILDILGRHPANNFLYCTIEFPNDKIRKELCPDAPSIESRLELIKEAKKIGIPVWVGISPFDPEWFDFETEIMDKHINNLVENGADIINFNLSRRLKKEEDLLKNTIIYSLMKKDEYKDIEFLQHIFPAPAKLKVLTHIKKHIPTVWELKDYLNKDTLDFEETPFEDIYDAMLKISDVSGFMEYKFNLCEFSAMNQRLLKFNECRGLDNMKETFRYLYNNRRILV